MFCIKCGTQLPDDAKFCHKCGQAVQGNVEEKVEEKVEKKPFKLGKMPPILKKVLVVLVVLFALAKGYDYTIEHWIIAEIPDPEDFFGLEVDTTLGLGDQNFFFASEWDPFPIIEKYVSYLENSLEDIKIEKSEDSRGNIFYNITYEGFWLGNSKPLLELSYYGQYYYGDDDVDYSFGFAADDNFKFVESECYAADVSVDEIVNSNTPNNSQIESKDETEKESEKVETNPFALPDPCLFFYCGRHEDQKYDNGDAWLVSCKFDLDEGKGVVQEYIDLLESEYPLERFDEAEEDYIRYNGTYFYDYYYRYTGTDINIPGFERDGRENTDVCVSLYYNYRAGTILVTFIYDNTFELVDCGEKASAIPTSYSGSPSNSGSSNSGSDYEQPEYTKLDCTFCHDGDCPKCDGYGTVEYYNGNGEYIDTSCPDCRGSGDCWRCGGTGKREN